MGVTAAVDPGAVGAVPELVVVVVVDAAAVSFCGTYSATKGSRPIGTVDTAGNLRFLVRQGATVDLYVTDGAATGDLPAKGLRIATPEKHAPVLARFAERAGAEKGGLSLLLVDRIPGEVPAVGARWHTLAGEKVGEIGPFPLPVDAGKSKCGRSNQRLSPSFFTTP